MVAATRFGYQQGRGTRGIGEISYDGLTVPRPHACLAITYRDLNLFLLIDSTTREMAIAFHLKLTRTKSLQKRKRP